MPQHCLQQLTTGSLICKTQLRGDVSDIQDMCVLRVSFHIDRENKAPVGALNSNPKTIRKLMNENIFSHRWTHGGPNRKCLWGGRARNFSKVIKKN